ncbi:hypothetical protein ACLWBD_10520 [Bdellovibrio sp. HCB117]|uniref:hypothetical protein n=1 Tax=Bdellovibrio sp. HCB117 TaxID=3394359 RepID=UPI0039B3753B
MAESVMLLKSFLNSRNLEVDNTAIRLLDDSQLVRLWNANGDLLFYNKTMQRVTSYTPLDLCYYDLKTLWGFQNDGYDRFKALVAQALLGKELSQTRTYETKENFSQGLMATHEVKMAVPIFSGDNIQGILISGTAEIRKAG